MQESSSGFGQKSQYLIPKNEDWGVKKEDWGVEGLVPVSYRNK